MHYACLQLRRQSCLASGAVSMLLGLQGASGPLLLSAAACLRFMALAPGAAEVLAGARWARGSFTWDLLVCWQLQGKICCWPGMKCYMEPFQSSLQEMCCALEAVCLVRDNER